MIAENVYKRPVVLSHQLIQFETRHSWNPGVGNNPDSTGNDGINFKDDNKNPQPCGAGTAGTGTSSGTGIGGTGQCNDQVN